MEKKKTSTKKKSVTTKKTTTKKTTPTKAKTEKKVTPKKTVATKKAEPKKTTTVTAKKTETKKATPKKVTPKKTKEAETKVAPQEEVLEKTYIFNKEEQANLSEVVEKMSKTKKPSYENIGNLNKENKAIILALTIAIVLIVVSCLIYVIVNINKYDSFEDSYIVDDKYKSAEDSTSSKSFKDADYSNLINTTIDDFEVKVAQGENMLVLISSDTCYYCVTFEPILNEVLVSKKDNAIRLNISKMSNNETQRLRNYYAFKAAPTLLRIKKGEVISDFEGFMEKEDLIKWYDENVK